MRFPNRCRHFRLLELARARRLDWRRTVARAEESLRLERRHRIDDEMQDLLDLDLVGIGLVHLLHIVFRQFVPNGGSHIMACKAVLDTRQRATIDGDYRATRLGDIDQTSNIASDARDAGHFRPIAAVERNGDAIRHLRSAGAARTRINQRQLCTVRNDGFSVGIRDLSPLR